MLKNTRLYQYVCFSQHSTLTSTPVNCLVIIHNPCVFSLFLSGCIAEYINLVLFDILHGLAYPTVLCLTIEHFCGNISIPEDCPTLSSTHQALLAHALWWSDLPADTKCHKQMVQLSFLSTQCKPRDFD